MTSHQRNIEALIDVKKRHADSLMTIRNVLVAVVVFILSVGCVTANEPGTARDDGEDRQASVRPPPVSASEIHNFGRGYFTPVQEAQTALGVTVKIL